MTDLMESIDSRGVATLTLNRPAKRNALDGPLVEALHAALLRLDASPDARIVVICGAGENFCAGGDIDWMLRIAKETPERNEADAKALANMLRALEGLSKPTVGLVHGAVYGGGVGLVCCCDIVIASDTTRLCLSEVRLGLIPATIGPFLVRAIGQRQARRYALSAEIIGAQEALRIGLLHEVRPAREFPEAGARLIETLLAGAPGAQTEAKSLLSLCYGGAIDDTLMSEAARRLAQRRASTEGREGLRAFLEKRSPSWVVRGGR